jgi:hypothetical protein
MELKLLALNIPLGDNERMLNAKMDMRKWK